MSEAAPSDAAPASSSGSSTRIVVAMAVMNVATFVFTWLTARIIGPQEYGAFVAVMNLLLIVGVAQLGIQATAARRISADPAHVGQIEREVLRVGTLASLGVGAVLLVGAPLTNRVLGLDSLPMAILVAIASVPLTMTGAFAGILQGERRWADLAFVYLNAGLPRLIVGGALIAWRPSGFAALAGVTIGFCAPVVYGYWALRHGREEGAVSAHHDSAAIIGESLRNSLALFAFYAVSNVDMLVARNVLSAHDSGLYGAGLIVARAVLFLPQFVVVVAFPSMSTAAERRRATVRSLTLIAVLGALCTAATWALSGLALVFAGGPKYAEVQSDLWLFAALGTVMSMVQLLVYSVLARQDRSSGFVVWIALAAMIGLGLTADSLNGLLTIVLAVDAVLLVVLLAMAWRTLRREDAEPAPAPPAAG